MELFSSTFPFPRIAVFSSLHVGYGAQTVLIGRSNPTPLNTGARQNQKKQVYTTHTKTATNLSHLKKEYEKPKSG